LNLGQLIGYYQLRLAEYEPVGRGIAAFSGREPVRPEKRGRAWMQDRIMAYIEERGGVAASVSHAEIQNALGISMSLASGVISRLVKAKRLVHTGKRRRYRYSKAPA